MMELAFRRIAGQGPAAGSETAHRLLEELTAKAWPEVPHPLPLHKDERGKPFFMGFPSRHFNLSHSGDWAACVLSDKPVGVDLQLHRAQPRRVAQRFTPQEQAWLEQNPAGFFDLWVKKEAYLKALGTGLTRRLDSFFVLPLERNRVGDYVIWLAEPPEPGYSCAVCQMERLPEEQEMVQAEKHVTRTEAEPNHG